MRIHAYVGQGSAGVVPKPKALTTLVSEMVGWLVEENPPPYECTPVGYICVRFQRGETAGIHFPGTDQRPGYHQCIITLSGEELDHKPIEILAHELCHAMANPTEPYRMLWFLNGGPYTRPHEMYASEVADTVVNLMRGVEGDISSVEDGGPRDSGCEGVGRVQVIPLRPAVCDMCRREGVVGLAASVPDRPSRVPAG